MNLSPTAQATLLLTSYFSKARSEDVAPLTHAEWGRFALWLREKSITPADLLVSDPKPLLTGWTDSRVSLMRIIQLLNRGHSLALAVEKWQRAGLWVVTRADAEYPLRFKQRLKTESPPVLFGCGDKTLLNAGGLAVIGSRNASDADLSFAEQIGNKAAAEGIAIVSGGARGVDEATMLGSMNKGGAVIGVMADSLLRAATSAKWRNGLMNGQVILVSPFYPEAGFNAGNAMARNKYIYCLADSALVIHSGKKGGTINGAEENLKKCWVPLWVKPTTDKDAANADLATKGGRWCEADIHKLKMSDLFSREAAITAKLEKEKQASSSMTEQPGLFVASESRSDKKAIKTETTSSQNTQDKTLTLSEKNSNTQELASKSSVDFYRLFITELDRLATIPVTFDALVKNTGLHKAQLNDWLKRATNDGVIKKLNRPVRYQVENKK